MVHVEVDGEGNTRVNVGEYLLTIVSAATPKEAVDKFVEIVRAKEEALELILELYDAKVQFNIDHPEQSRDWPIFKKRERFIDEILKEAGIRNT